MISTDSEPLFFLKISTDSTQSMSTLMSVQSTLMSTITTSISLVTSLDSNFCDS